MKVIIYSAIIILFIQACDVPIDLDIDQVPSRLVIQGQVTDKESKSFIYLTWTSQFYEKGEPRTEQNATVKVTDNDGNSTFFTHNSDSLGLYIPPFDFIGEIGKYYLLEVLVDGITYTAGDTMPTVAKIDSLTSGIDVRESLDPAEENLFYQIKLFGKEPPEKNFYLFRFYRNWELTRRFEGDIYTTDDNILGADISGIPFPIYYAKADTAVLDMYGISRTAFIYYADLQLALGNDGGLFSPPPANPRSNIQGEAMGFFLVSSIASDTIVVKE